VSALDRRLHALRDDLADARLQGRVEAPRFVEGRMREVAVPVAPLRRAPDEGAMLDSQALRGECLRVFDEARGWAWAQLETDGYVGYLPSAALREPGPEPTHRVRALATFVYPEPDMKRPVAERLNFGARLAVSEEAGDFFRLALGGFVWRGHLRPLDAREEDFVEVALRFRGVPYLWGGRSSDGLDCSGLVQTAMAATGVRAPRDSDMLEGLGQPLDPAALEGLRRGDLVFWRGHLGIVLEEARLLHANGHHMAVEIEPLAEAVARIAGAGLPLKAARRLG